jgi:hypothetical protein
VLTGAPDVVVPLILVNQARQSHADHYPLKLGCARWHDDKRTCSGHLRRIDGRIPFLEPPICPRGTRMRVKYTKDGRPWAWTCDHRNCRPIRWVSGDCLDWRPPLSSSPAMVPASCTASSHKRQECTAQRAPVLML